MQKSKQTAAHVRRWVSSSCAVQPDGPREPPGRKQGGIHFREPHRLGLFSWKRSPPSNNASTLRRWACCKISSNALNESFFRISSACGHAKFV